MSAVDLHPHFVSARNYEDVKTVVGLLKDPIDSDDFVQPEDAPFLPPAYTTTIHFTEAITGAQSSRNSAAAETSVVRKDLNGNSGAREPYDDDDDRRGGADSSPAAPDVEFDSPSFFASVPRSHAPPASTTEFRMRRRASSYYKPKQHPKILCLWDVDDTLVATGVSGVRQNLVFREPDLVALFRSAGPHTRHLLLSQGSIDDVFDEPGGRLRCIQKFVQRPPAAPSGPRRAPPSAAAPKTSGASGSGPSAKPATPATKEKSSFADLLRCGGGKQAKAQPSSSSSASRGRSSKNAEEGVGGTNERDMRHLAPGTVVVRLSSMHDRAEEAADSAFLTDATKQPTCARASSTPLDEKAERMGRWLILRPEIWGITLASMNTMFPSSRNTAFVNGKVYRKMDVAWSLAMTGEWDSVFFIDNNLSEVGVVRYGMQMSDVLNLRSGRKVWRFFQSEFLLLAASAKLREMELRYGRDVTKPPPTPPTREVNAVAAKANAAASAEAAGDGGELTPSKSAATSSTDSGPGGANGKTRGRTAGRAGSPGRAVHVDVAEDVKIIDRPVVVAEGPPPSDRSESLSLTSASPRHPNGTTPLFPKSPLSPAMRVSKDVDLVVVNLHMSCDAYRRVLTTARTNSEGQCSLQREGSLPARYVGQPVFMGDRSCTDEQYDAILKYFQETESGLFQLLEEEMRHKGYVDVKMSNRWMPGPHTVHAPIRRRPDFIPHMPLYYTPFFDEVEERVVRALQKYGGTSASCTLHSEAQRQYFTLQRVLPFIDPYLTGDLGRMLFDIYIKDGSIPRSLADSLKKVLNRVRERIIPRVEKK